MKFSTSQKKLTWASYLKINRNNPTKRPTEKVMECFRITVIPHETLTSLNVTLSTLSVEVHV